MVQPNQTSEFSPRYVIRLSTAPRHAARALPPNSPRKPLKPLSPSHAVTSCTCSTPMVLLMHAQATSESQGRIYQTATDWVKKLTSQLMEKIKARSPAEASRERGSGPVIGCADGWHGRTIV